RRKRRPNKEGGVDFKFVSLWKQLIGEAEFPKTQARQVRKRVVGMPNKIFPAKWAKRPRHDSFQHGCPSRPLPRKDAKNGQVRMEQVRKRGLPPLSPISGGKPLFLTCSILTCFYSFSASAGRTARCRSCRSRSAGN